MNLFISNALVVCLTLQVGCSQNYDVDNFPPMHTGSQCFHVKGIPTLQLRCPGGQLIRVQQCFYGAPPNNKTCRFVYNEKHCIQLTDMTENCMGRYMCSVYVSNPFLSICRKYANYMQVNYTCVPKPKIYNMCQNHMITTRHGYISTPNYPDANYTANQHCRCRLQTKDKGILLQLLDFSINHTERGRCNSDYLKITDWGNKCGYINPKRLPERLTFNRHEVFLEFVSDSQYEARGMWLEFNGSQGGKVKLTCTSEGTSPSNRMEYNPDGASLGVPDPLSEVDDSDGQLVDKDDMMMMIEDDVREDDADVIPKRRPEFNPDLAEAGSERTRQRATTYPMKEKNDDKTGQENEVNSKPGIDVFAPYDLNAGLTDDFRYNKVDEVQIITGVVVGVLILIAVVIIIVLVFRR